MVLKFRNSDVLDSGLNLEVNSVTLAGSNGAVIVESLPPNAQIGQTSGFFISPGTFIQRFSFSSDGNSSIIARQLTDRLWSGGNSSTTHGYSSGGAFPATNTIERYPFSISTGTMTDVGDLTAQKVFVAGMSSSTSGYVRGGSTSLDPTSKVVEKFPFAATTTNATSLGDKGGRAGPFSTGRNINALSTSTHGYSAGFVDRFAFATDSPFSTVIDSPSLNWAFGQPFDFVGSLSGVTHGYQFGGSPSINLFEKFAFASSSLSTLPRSLPTPIETVAGNSSTTDGYMSGGRYVGSPGGPTSNSRLRFPFASDTVFASIGITANTSGICFASTQI